MDSSKYLLENYEMYNLDDLCPRHRLEMLKHQNGNHSSAEQPEKEADYLEYSLEIFPCELTSSSNILFSHLCPRHRVELQQKRHNNEKSREFLEEIQRRWEEKSASSVPYAHDAKESCSICTKQTVKVCDNNDNSSSAVSCDRDFDLGAKYEHEWEEEVSGSKEDEENHSEEKNPKEYEVKKCDEKEERTKLPIECIAKNNCLLNHEHTTDCRQIDREQQSDKSYCKLKSSPLSKNASEETLYAKRHDNNVEKRVEERECNILKQVNCEVALLELSIPEIKYKRLSASNVNNNATTFNNYITNMCKDNCPKNEKMKEYDSSKCNNEDKDSYCQKNNNESHIASLKGLRKEYNVSLQSSNRFVDSDREEELLQKEKRKSVGKLDHKKIEPNSKTDSLFRSTPSPYSALSPFLRTSKHMSEEHVAEMQHHISDRKPYYYFEQSVTPLLPCEIPPRTCSAPTHPYDLFSEKVLPPLRLSHSHVKSTNYNNNSNNNSNNKANTYINGFTRPSHKYNVKSQTENNNHNVFHQNARISEIETEKAEKIFFKSGETSMFSSLLSCTRLPLAPINLNELVASVHSHKKRSPSRYIELSNTVVNEILNECKEHAPKTIQTSTENIEDNEINTNANKCRKNVQPHSTLSKENTSKSEEVKKCKQKKKISKATAHTEAVSKTISPHTESDTQLEKEDNIKANQTYCKSQKNDGAKLSQETIADNQHLVTEHLICAEKEENNYTSKKIGKLSAHLSPWQSSSLQRVSHSIEFAGDYWQCLVEEFARAVEDAAQNDIAAALGVTINSVQEVKCFCFAAKKFEESITEPSKHIVRKDDTKQSSECDSRCVVHFVVTCPHTWNKEQVYRLLDSNSFPNLWRLHNNLTCKDWLSFNKLPMEQKCEMEVLTLAETESSESCHVNERNKNVMLREDRNAINNMETRTIDTPENSNVNNNTKSTALRRKTKNENNVKGNGEENDDNDNGENIDSHANTEMGECKENAEEKHHLKKNELINNEENTLRKRDEEENKCKANTVEENISLTEHVDSKNKVELCNLDGPLLIHDLSTPCTSTKDSREYNANSNEYPIKKYIKCSPEPSNHVHIDAFSKWFQKESKKEQQENEEQWEEENHNDNMKITCIVKNKASANDVELHTHIENTIAASVNDDFVDADNAHTPRNKNYGIDSYINNSALSTPSHTSSYCTPTSRTHFASLIKFDSEERVKLPKSKWGITTNDDDNDDNTKFFFKAWSPLMDELYNEISATFDNNINVSDDSCIKRIVANEHEDHFTAHRLSSQNNKDENGMLEYKQTNKQISNRIVSSKSLSSSPSISSDPHLSSKLLTDATEEASNISNEEHGQTSLQKYSTSIYEHKFTEPLPRHICICVEPYLKIHMVVFFGRQWENVLQQCKANETSVLKTVMKDMNDVVQSNLAKHHNQIHVNYITAESSSLIAKFTAICDDTHEDQICSTTHDGDSFSKYNQEVESLITIINNSINASPMQHTWSLYGQFAKEYETAEQRTEICKSNATIEHDSRTLQGMEPKLTLVSGEEVKRLTQLEAELKLTSYDVLPRLPVTRVCVEPSIEFAKHMTLHRSFASTNWEPLFSLVVIDEATAKECFAAETKYMLRAKDCVVQSLQFAMCENVMSAAETTDQAMSLTFLCLVEYDNIKCTREEQDKVNAYNYATLNKVVSEFYTLLSANIQTNANHHHHINSANSSFLLLHHAGKFKHNAQAVSQSHSSHSLSATEPTLSPSESAPASMEQWENATQRRVIHDNMKLEYIYNPDKCAINDNHSNSNDVQVINGAQNSKQNNTYIAINESAQRACSSHIESPYTCRTHRVNGSLESISPSPAPIPSPLPCTNTSCNMMEQNEKLEELEEEKVLLSTLEYLRSKSNDEHLPDCRSGVCDRVEKNLVSSARAAKIIPEIDDVHKFFDSESASELLNSSSETKCCKEYSKDHRESREFVENSNRANSNRSEHSINIVRMIPEEKETDNGVANNSSSSSSSSSNIMESHCSILHPVEAPTSSLFSDSNESDLRSMSNTSSHMVYFCAKNEPPQTNESHFVWDDEVNIVSDVEELLQEYSESILSKLTLSSSSPSELLASLLLEEMEVKTETTTSLQECLSADSLLQLYASEQESSELLEGNINPSAHTSKENNKSHTCKTATQKVNTKEKKTPLHNSSETKTGQAHSTKDSKTLNKKQKGNKKKKKKNEEMKKKKNYNKNIGKEKQSTVSKRNKENNPKTSAMSNKKHNRKSIKWLQCVLHGSHWPAVEHLAEEELSSALCEDFMNATKCLPYKFVEGWGTARSDGLHTRYALEKKDLRMANVKVSSQQKTLLKKLEKLEQEKIDKTSRGKQSRQVANNENLTFNIQSERKTHDNDWCDEEVAEITNYIKKYHFPCVWEVYHKFNLSRDERFSPTMSWNLSNRIKSTQASLSYGATLVAMTDDDVKEDFVNDEWTVHLENLQEMRTTELMESSINNSEKLQSNHEQFEKQECYESKEEEQNQQMKKKVSSARSGNKRICSKILHDEQSKTDKYSNLKHADYEEEQTENVEKKNVIKHTLVQEMESVGSDAPHESVKEFIEVSCESYQPDKEPSMQSMELRKIVFGQAFTGQRWCSVVENDKDYFRACFIKDAANALRSYTHLSNGIFDNVNEPTYTIDITALAVKQNKLNVYYTVTPSNDVHAEENIVKAKKMFKKFVCDSMQSYNFPLTWALHDLHFAEQVNSPVLSRSSSPTSNKNKIAIASAEEEEKEQKMLKSNTKTKELSSLHKANSYVVKLEVKQTTTALESESEWAPVSKSKVVNTNDEQINANINRNNASTAVHKVKKHKVKSEEVTSTEVVHTLCAEPHEQKVIKHAMQILHEHCGSAKCEDENEFITRASSTRRRLENALSHSMDMASDGKLKETNIAPTPIKESSVSAAKVKNKDDVFNTSNDQKVAEIQTVEEKELEQFTPVDHMSHIELQKSAIKKQEYKRHTKKHTLRLAHVSKLLEQLDQVQKMAESFPNELNNAIKTLPDRLERKHKKYLEEKDNSYNEK